MNKSYFIAALLVWGSIIAFGSGLPVVQKEPPSVRGRVVYADGKIATRAQVSAFKDGPMAGRIPMTYSDNEGRFVLTGVEDGVEYSLCASKQLDGYWDPYFLPFGLPSRGKCKKVTVEGVVSNVVVALAPKGGEIEGEVRDARSGEVFSLGKVVVFRPLKFLSGEWTIVSPPDATYVPTAEAAIEDNGHFKISGLPTGRYL